MNFMIKIFLAALLISSCTVKNNSITISKPITQGDRVIEQAKNLYELREIKEAILLLENYVNSLRNKEKTEDFFISIELIITWLLELDEYDDAKRVLGKIIKRYPREQRLNKAIEILSGYSHDSKPFEFDNIQPIQENLIQDGTITNKNIGVFLPLSGQLKIYGQGILRSLLKGFNKEYEINDITSQDIFIEHLGITLKVRDSKEGNNILEDEHLANIFMEEDLSLILGGIIENSAIKMAQLAHKNNLPLITFARSKKLYDLSPYVMSLSFTNEKQMFCLVDYSLSLGMRKFAVFYPDHQYGKNMTHIYKELIEQQGGELVKEVSYDAKETTFTKDVARLVSMDKPHEREEYKECMKEKDNKICLEELKPKIEFDALFVPEFGKIAYVIPALIHADIFISDDDKKFANFKIATKNSEAKKVKLLATKSINKKEIISKIGNKANGMIFFDSQNKSTTSEDFFADDIEYFAFLAAKFLYDEFPYLKNDKELILTTVSHKVKKLMKNPCVGYEVKDGIANPL